MMAEKTVGSTGTRVSWLLFPVVFGLSLFSFPLGQTPVLASDLALLAWIAFGFWHERKPQPGVVAWSSAGWLAVATVGGVWLLVRGSLVPTEFLGSLLRAAAGVAAVWYVGPAIRAVGTQSVATALAWTARVHAAALIALYSYEVAMGGRVQRAEGLFGEPAWFGWFMGLSLLTVYQLSLIDSRRHLGWLDLLGIGVALYLNRSLTGLILIPFGLALNGYLLLLKGYRPFQGRRALVLMLILVFLVVYQMVGASDYFSRRLQRIVDGKDVSALDRVPGTWEATAAIVGGTPWTGTGLGGLEPVVRSLQPQLRFKAVASGDLHVTFASAFATTGLIGGLLYLALMALLVARPGSRWVGVGLSLAGFAYGGYLLGTLWWFIGLGAGLHALDNGST